MGVGRGCTILGIVNADVSAHAYIHIYCTVDAMREDESETNKHKRMDCSSLWMRTRVIIMGRRASLLCEAAGEHVIGPGLNRAGPI